MSNSKNNAKLIRRMQEIARRKKQGSNDDNSSSSGDHTSDSDYEPGNSDKEEMDIHEYRKFLQKIFPSKNLDKKIKMGEKVKKNAKKYVSDNDTSDSDSDSESDDTDDKNRRRRYKKTKQNKKVSKNKKDCESSSEDVSEDDSESEEYSEEELSDDENDSTEGLTHTDDENVEGGNGKKNAVNIIFTIGGLGQEEEDGDWETEDDEEYVETDDDTEDEDVSVSSASSISETGDSENDSKSCEEETNKKNKKCKHDKMDKKRDTCKKTKKEKNKNNDNNVIKSMKELIESTTVSETSNDEESEQLLGQLKQLYENNKKNKTLQKCIEMYEKDIEKTKLKREKKQKKQKDKNTRIFKKILLDKNTTNDFTFFQKMDVDTQKKMIKELREINKISRIEKPYRMTLLESDMPTLFKSAAMKKVNSLRYMDPGSGEYYKIKNWVDTFMRIPFGKYNTLPINIEDGVDKCHDFMENAQKILNDAVYGLNDAKMQIMQLLGQLVTNPKAVGTAIAIHGPPGTGKTSLVKEGISKILNRPFAFLALGGATDSSFLEGHGYTYEGSTWGKIVQILIDSKCMNPVIYFDELDKISDTPKGEEIAGILTHLTDTTQNSQFHDKYFAEIDFDLSKCLFIFSYNDESKVNPILKDRMYRIQTKGYNQKQKTVISYDYLLPKIREQVKFSSEEIIIPDATIHYIIENFCNKEDGVRNLKRCLEIVHTKLNLYRLMKPNSNLFEEDMSLKVEFPFTVTKDVIDKLIKNEDKNKMSALYGMYV